MYIIGSLKFYAITEKNQISPVCGRIMKVGVWFKISVPSVIHITKIALLPTAIFKGVGRCKDKCVKIK